MYNYGEFFVASLNYDFGILLKLLWIFVSLEIMKLKKNNLAKLLGLEKKMWQKSKQSFIPFQKVGKQFYNFLLFILTPNDDDDRILGADIRDWDRVDMGQGEKNFPILFARNSLARSRKKKGEKEKEIEEQKSISNPRRLCS